MFSGPVGPVEVFFYWPEAVFGNFYWPGAIGLPLASSPEGIQLLECKLSLFSQRQPSLNVIESVRTFIIIFLALALVV